MSGVAASAVARLWFADLRRDFASVAVLALLALLVGLGVNSLRSAPLSLTYHSPAERLAAELTHLVEAPPFRLEDLDTIDLEEFRGLVNAGQALVLDARAESFYRSGHIPGALNLSRQDFAHDYNRLRPSLEKSKDRLVVVYCSGGECHDSRLVASALLSLGYAQVKIFTGGWAAWSASGAPIAQ